MAERVYRRRRRRVGPWQKMAYFVLGALVLIAAFGAVRKTFRPLLLCYQQRKEIHRSEDKLQKLKVENQRLRAKKPYLESQSGAETEARKIGYIRPGEISIIIDGGRKNSIGKTPETKK